ncbi:hypothetical protein ILUMI_08315 [Ignelater luminosus]|uniref:PiggyBac transposable element-derived protein domain-containing protein n=1 Tax=Ignelater luminosus TaxID=2038154 RepID=A0A8K0D265_IGNLU|nr:hypothetical protein ILUMI_08315 [Ignelater luminosus]
MIMKHTQKMMKTMNRIGTATEPEGAISSDKFEIVFENSDEDLYNAEAADRDEKMVLMRYNFHGSNTGAAKRKQKDGTKKDITAPEVCEDYNKYMGGVNHAKRLRVAYRANRRAKTNDGRASFGD